VVFDLWTAPRAATAATPGPATAATRGPGTTATRGPGTTATRSPGTTATRSPGTTTPTAGTAIIARIGPGAASSPLDHTSPLNHSSPSDRATRIRVGGILSARPGERESGDAWGVLWDADTITVVIMDGLGHGPEAAAAAANGLREAAARAGADDPVTLLGRLDRRLLGGRGAVAAVARLSRHELAFGGVGNIGARLGPNGRSHGLVSSMGTLGLGQRLRPQATVTPWGAHSLFTAHTDGIRPSWDLSRYPGVTRHDLAVMAALIWRDAATRGDDAAIVITATAAELAAAEDAGGTVGRP
jgi:hypothetical protein